MGVNWYLTVVLISLMTNDVEHLSFHVLVGLLYIFFGEHLDSFEDTCIEGSQINTVVFRRLSYIYKNYLVLKIVKKHSKSIINL